MITIDFVKHLYERFIQEDVYEYSDWYEKYKAAGDFISKLRDYLLPGINLDNAAIGEIADKPPWGGEKRDLVSFLNFYWEKNYNGVSNVAQGQISSQDFIKLRNCEKGQAYQSLSFIDLNEKIISAQDMAGAFELTKQWFTFFCKSQGVNYPQVVIRRFFSALYPGKLTSLITDQKINVLMMNIVIPKVEGKIKWLEKNTTLTAMLDNLPSILEDDNYKRSIFFYYLYEFLFYPFQEEKQTVFYGSPGTGKTRRAKRTAENHFEDWKLLSRATTPEFKQAYQVVQFHPSFTYEDFIEGIRPGKLVNGNVQLELVNGVFKEFCWNAAQWEFDYYKTPHFQKLLKDPGDGEPPSFETLKVKVVKEIGFCTNDPWKHLEDKPDDDSILQYIPPFFFVIDEINRAELSRVLGELMYCLEYRGYHGKLQTQYSNLVKGEADPAAFWYEDKKNYFFVPHNVYIVGTMNTIDRSVESFDFALRRRFCWKRVDPSPSALRAFLTNKSIKPKLTEEFIGTVVEKMMALNKEIEKHPLLGADFKIGHTYFFEVAKYGAERSTSNALERIWNNKLQSLLEEYLRGLGNRDSIKGEIEDWKKLFCKVENRRQKNGVL
jgi:5-methylcytosine-specific restriction enzyme B